MTQKKLAHGLVLDIDDKRVLTEVELEISLVQPNNPNDKPIYNVIGCMNSYKPEIAEKPIILTINGCVSGNAQIHIIDQRFKNLPKIKVEIFLQDSLFANKDWFNCL